MQKKPHYIPEGFHTITPYLIVKDGIKALEFYKKAFHAIEVEKHLTEDGKLLHARVKIGDTQIMLSEENLECGCEGLVNPLSLKGTSMMLHMYVEDVDSAFQKAIDLGAKTLLPVADMFWGDRYGQLQDPFGHRWSLGTPLITHESKK